VIVADHGGYSLAFGTPLLQADLVTPDIQFDPTIKKRAPRPSGGTFNDVPIVGTLFQFEFIPRNADAAVSISLPSAYCRN
jgi:hypothetical protein